MECKFCKKEYENVRSLTQHVLRCKDNPKRIKHTGGAHKGRVPWNKGLTKETDCRIKEASSKISASQKGEKNHFYGKHHSKETIIKMKKVCGGLRKGSGHGKMGWYKGFYCRSSWELAWLIYQLEHNQNVKPCDEYFEYSYNNEIHKYYPDFKINDIYYEIKGQHFENLASKLEQFPKEKTLIMIDGKKEIKPYLDYVIERYGKDFIKLYEK